MRQRQLSVGIGEVAKLVEVPESEVKLCRNEIEAVRLAMRRSPVQRSDWSWAELLGMSPSQFNTILNLGGSSGRKRNPPVGFFSEMQRLTQTDAISKYFALQIGRTLDVRDDREQRKRELLAELQQLEATG